MMSAALRQGRMVTPRVAFEGFLLFMLATQGLTTTTNDSPFTLNSRATSTCMLKRGRSCYDVRWTTGDRLLVVSTKKCLGSQGSNVGSEVSQYDCDENSNLQKWECKNGTLLALKGQDLYIELKADESVALSKTVGPNNHFVISGTASGACTRTYREYYTLGGNAFGKICMFPFLYKDRWFVDCTTYDASSKRAWCAVETKYEHEQYGYCPTTSTEHWSKNIISRMYYQMNMQSALTWAQADASCKQQAAALVSIVDPSEKAFITALMGKGRNRAWIGLVLDSEHGWMWTDGKPVRYLKWDAGHPVHNPGYNCGLIETSGRYAWQSSSCTKKMGYICYKGGNLPAPPRIEQGFCSAPWIPYNSHCYFLQRTALTWPDAQRECRKEGGDLVTVGNLEEQSFVISQLGYAPTDELWIGLNDRNMEGLFDWSDHSTVTFTSWEFGKPGVSSDGQDCVLIRGENGNWADRSCDEQHGFICMKQSSTERPAKEVEVDVGCKIGWKRHGSYCYFVGTETKTFNEAKEDCKSSQAYLADVSNGVDNAFLVSLVGLRPEPYFWIGLSNENTNEVFAWTNTISVKFTHWNAGMPANLQGCVAMATGISAGLWNVLPCKNQEKYICKHAAVGAVTTVPPPTQTPAKCPEGWGPVGTRSMCSKFFTGPRSQERTWFESRDYCRAIGGDLLSIHHPSELITSRRGGKAWIGLHIADPTNGYEWSDGSPVNFLHWQDGEPNNHNNDESCAEFVTHDWDETGSWNDLNCETYNDWLCQIRAGEVPKPPPNDTAANFNMTADGWIVWRGKQYFINRMSKSMEEARLFCQQRHGDLLSISSKEENVFLWKQISRSYGSYYIGLSVDLDGSFWWIDGTPLSYQRWDENQPNTNNYDENCVSMSYHMGYWRTSNCGKEFQSICKRTTTSPVNSTVAPTQIPIGGCQQSWTKFGTKCYKIFTDRKDTWENARTSCMNLEATLVSIPSRKVQAFFTTRILKSATDVWIGLNSINQDGYYWTDGKSRKYTNWGYTKNQRRPGSFYQRWNEENCVLMSGSASSGLGKWLIRSCNDTNGYICQKNIKSSYNFGGNPIDPNIYERLANDSIKALTQNLTWDDAKTRCENDKANLASLRNEWSTAYIELLTSHLKAPLWIGLNKEKTEGYFKYVDNWHMSIANWGEFEPSRDRPCVFVDVDGKWKTAFCNQTYYSACMRTTDVPPTESTKFGGRCPEDTNVQYQDSYTWLPFKENCYLFVTDQIEWADAASSCVRHGGVLASIKDPSEQSFIRSNIAIFQDSHTSFWIGLFKTHAGMWFWLDKTPLDYVNWAPDEPDAEYGAIRAIDGNWTSGRRWHDRSYICKTPRVTSIDSESKAEPHGGEDRSARVHTSLVVVLLIIVFSSLTALGVFLYKRSPRPFPTFENPLYFNGERSPPDVVDTNKLIENAENPDIQADNNQPILTL